METLWFVLVAFMLTAYVVLDGFDLGAGVISLFVAQGHEERNIVLKTIGPVWDGNEVWLIAAGGALYFAFPSLYAAAFSGFYLPLMIVLWLLMLRGIGVELRSHVDNPLWWSAFDFLFTASSLLLAVFFGAAIGNVMRGVPLDKDGFFFEALWTDFRVGPHPGILDWYTSLTGVLALVSLTVHGALLCCDQDGRHNKRPITPCCCHRVASAGWFNHRKSRRDAVGPSSSDGELQAISMGVDHSGRRRKRSGRDASVPCSRPRSRRVLLIRGLSGIHAGRSRFRPVSHSSAGEHCGLVFTDDLQRANG